MKRFFYVPFSIGLLLALSLSPEATDDGFFMPGMAPSSSADSAQSDELFAPDSDEASEYDSEHEGSGTSDFADSSDSADYEESANGGVNITIDSDIVDSAKDAAADLGNGFLGVLQGIADWFVEVAASILNAFGVHS